MDVGEEVVQPLADVDLCQFAASHEGVDDGSILGCIVVSAEEIVLASLCPGVNYVGIIDPIPLIYRYFHVFSTT